MERRKAHIPYPMRRQADDHCGWRTEGSRCRRKEDSKVLGRVPAADVQMPLCNSLPAARVFKLQSRDWREQEEAREKEGDLKFVWQLHWVEIIRFQFLTWFSNSNHELGSTTRGPRHTKTVVSFTVAPSGPNRQAQIYSGSLCNPIHGFFCFISLFFIFDINRRRKLKGILMAISS